MKLSLWYNTDNEQEAGAALYALAQKHREQFSARKSRALDLLSQYEGLALGQFNASAYDVAEPLEFWTEDTDPGDAGPDARVELTWNIGASIMDSIDAKLFALDKIKTQFVVTDGGWEVKRSAILAGRFIEGQMSEPQGIFPDMWALWRHGARLAETATGACAVFFWSDLDEGKVVAELDDTLNMFVETSGLVYDGITSIGRITYWDPEKLASKFPKFREQILAAAETPENELKEATQDEELPPEELKRVALVQGWRMATGKVKGSYCAAIAGGTTLVHTEYKSTEPPCVFYIPMRQLAGFWGRTRLERIQRPVQRLNEIVASLDDAERLTPKGVIFYDPTVTDKKTLLAVQNVVAIPYTGPAERKPTYEPPPPFHPATLELLKLHRDACFDLSGMSEAHVTASRERGLSSGVAIRLVQDQVYERFAPTEEEFSRCVGPATARQIIRCAREIMEANGSFSAVWKSSEQGGFLSEIPADVFKVLERHKYRAEPHSVSGNVNTPADRVELAEKLMSSGVITGEAYSAILQHFDVPGQSEAGTSAVEEAFVARQIDSWLYAKVGEAERRYLGPQKWMALEQRVLQVGGAYLQAMMDMAADMENPEVVRRLGFFSRFIADCEAFIEEKKLRELKLQEAAKAAGMAPGAMGPAPGAPTPAAAPPPMAA